MAKAKVENRKNIKGWNEMSGKWVGQVGVPRKLIGGKKTKIPKYHEKMKIG